MPPVYPYKKQSKSKTTSYYFKTCINGHQYLRRGFTSKSEAKAAEAAFRVKMMKYSSSKRRKLVEKAPTWDVLLSSYLAWMKSQIKITYYYILSKTLDHEIKPLLPNIEVDKLTMAHFEKARNKLQRSPNCAKTKNERLRLLKRVFDYCKIFYSYECLDVQKLTPFKDYSIQKKEIKQEIITFSIFKEIYNYSNDYYKLLYLTLYLYGLRIGELMGLCVNSFDFEKKILYIYRSISWKTGTGSFLVVSPKTPSSNRALWMIDSYITILKEHIRVNKLKANDYIFFSSRSKKRPLSEHSVRNNIVKVGKHIGFSFRPHMFRHTNVSELREKGISLEDIQKLEGHSSIEVTEKVYLHETEARKARTKSVLEDFMKELIKS